MAEVSVVRLPTGAWAVACTLHGVNGFVVYSPDAYLMANLDAMGHAAAFHPRTVLASGHD